MSTSAMPRYVLGVAIPQYGIDMKRCDDDVDMKHTDEKKVNIYIGLIHDTIFTIGNQLARNLKSAENKAKHNLTY